MRMTRKLLLLVGFTVLLHSAMPLGASTRTNARPDGEYWLSLKRAERLQLITGMFTGISMAISYGELSTEAGSKLQLDMTFDEIVATFDTFYSEPRNKTIRIESAWIIGVMRHAGVQEQVISKLIGDLRGVANGNLPDRSEPLPTKYPEVYDVALNYVDRSKVLRELLGGEIEIGRKRANAWALGPDQGEAYVFVDVKGPKAEGRLNGHAKRSGGKWLYDDLEVLVIGTGEIVDILQDTKH
jgi:hypothetical protein